MKKFLSFLSVTVLVAGAALAADTVTVPATITGTHTVSSNDQIWQFASGGKVTFSGATAELLLLGNVDASGGTIEFTGIGPTITNGDASNYTIIADHFNFAGVAVGSLDTYTFTGGGTISLLGSIHTNSSNRYRNNLNVDAGTTLILGGVNDIIDMQNPDN